MRASSGSSGPSFQDARQEQFRTHLVAAARLHVAPLGGRALAATASGRNDHSLGLHVDDGEVAAFHPAMTVVARFIRSGDASYAFTTSVRAVFPGSSPNLLLDWPLEIERHQARHHVRVALPGQAALAPAGPRRVDQGANGWSHAELIDVSAGGVGVACDADLDIGCTALVRFSLQHRGRHLEVDSRAMVVRRDPDAPDEPHRYGLQLLDLPSRTENDLTAALFWHLTAVRRADT
jgi:c-di-GMP-binding flagellar brake protein YcgR